MRVERGISWGKRGYLNSRVGLKSGQSWGVVASALVIGVGLFSDVSQARIRSNRDQIFQLFAQQGRVFKNVGQFCEAVAEIKLAQEIVKNGEHGRYRILNGVPYAPLFPPQEALKGELDLVVYDDLHHFVSYVFEVKCSIARVDEAPRQLKRIQSGLDQRTIRMGQPSRFKNAKEVLESLILRNGSQQRRSSASDFELTLQDFRGPISYGVITFAEEDSVQGLYYNWVKSPTGDYEQGVVDKFPVRVFPESSLDVKAAYEMLKACQGSGKCPVRKSSNSSRPNEGDPVP